MRTVTVEQFRRFNPCWLDTEEGTKRFDDIASIRQEWSAIDILDLPDVSNEDKLWAILRPEFVDDSLMHEFACRCAERALSRITNPDVRSIVAISAKRAWLRGEITDNDLYAARAAAWAAAWDAARAAAWAAAKAAAWAAAKDAARAAAWAAAWDAARAAAKAEEKQWQRDELIKMLKEEE